MDEAGLVAAAMRGDRDAFSGLVRLHQERLRALVALSIPVQDDVHDVVQEAFIDAWMGLPRFDTSREFGPWLRTICRNRARKFLRDRLPTRRRELALVDEVLLATAPPADDEIAEVRLRALRTCLAALDAGHRHLLTRRYLDAMAVKDLATALGKSEGGISMILLRLKATLMRCVAERIPGGAV